jgi:hypothetical protein
MTAALVAAAAFLGYFYGYRVATHDVIELTAADKARARAVLTDELRTCYAESERQLQTGVKSPPLDCHLTAYMRSVQRTLAT